MATAKTKEQKPWDKLGITYQQYYYRENAAKKKGEMPPSERLAMLKGLNGTQPGPDVIRDKILVEEFLARCEIRQALGYPVTVTMELSTGMSNAIYNTLRADGH